MKEMVVAISGAAGGLGPTVVRAFFGVGALLALAGRDKVKLEGLADSLRAQPARCLISPVDLGDPASARGWADEVAGRFGRIDAMIHLVGGYASGGPTLAELSLDDWGSLETKLVRTTFCVVRAFAAPLAASKGRFIGVTSPKTQAPTAKSAVYAMGKAATDTLVLALADELRGTGATANLIVVDSIDSPESRGAAGAKPTPRSTPAEQIAAAMLYLCSSEAAGINGAKLPLNSR